MIYDEKFGKAAEIFFNEVITILTAKQVKKCILLILQKKAMQLI